MKVLFCTSDRGVYKSELLFREEVIRTSGVEVYPYGKNYNDNEYKRVNLTDKVESLGGVDVILLSIAWTVVWEECFKKSKALKVSIATEFYEGGYRDEVYKKHYEDMKYDIIFGHGTTVVEYLKKLDLGRWRYCLPFGVDTEVFKKLDTEKVIDVLAAYTWQTKIPGVYIYREKMHEVLAKMYVISCVGIVPFDNLVEMTNRSRIVVNSSSKYNFVNPRVTETLSCGSFLLTSYCDDLIKFGYKDGEHLVMFNNIDDFTDKINYFLKNEKEREEIAENGMKFVRANYSNTKRVETMFDIISRHL